MSGGGLEVVALMSINDVKSEINPENYKFFSDFNYDRFDELDALHIR
jgi:hypothetical protein